MPSKIKDNIETWSLPAIFAAIVGNATAPLWAPANSNIDVSQQQAVLVQRVTALETYFVTLDSRERQNRDAIMLMLTELKGAVSRIEGKLEK